MNLDELKLTERRKNICHKLALNNGEEILQYYPFRYENYVEKPFSSWQIKDIVFFHGKILSYPAIFRSNRTNISTFKMIYDQQEIKIILFNRPWFRASIGQTLTVVGKYEGGNKVIASNVSFKPIEEEKGIKAIYPLKEGISQNDIHKLIEAVYKKEETNILENLPSFLLTKHGLIARQEALYNIHFPGDPYKLKQAIVRLKYEEFLSYFLALEVRRESLFIAKNKKSFSIEEIDKFIKQLPFSLTSDQLQASHDILNDLMSEQVMNRLLQGDVGSGKTVVAASGLYANYLAGYQAAFMAPTEILAIQHEKTLQNLFNKYDLKIACLTSSGENSAIIKKQLENNEIDIIVGTHILFSDDIKYHNLGFVIADEQQRFGVMQRNKLRQKGDNVDYLSMSATPIPRTLASALYGDIDISYITTMPKERKKCFTYLIHKNSIIDIIPDIKETLKRDEQVYIIASLIAENENLKQKDAVNLYNHLKELFKPYKVALLHGKMSGMEKESVMACFVRNEINILISTTVIEVGVNVENATMMIVYDSDRFGLAQLHQLRGRIKRGNKNGKFYLLTGSKDPRVLARLSILAETDDGFRIAEEDLRNRGPGDLIGKRQSGLPLFRLSNPLEDKKIMEAALFDAKELINLDDELSQRYILQIKQNISTKFD